jgi:hypothetical protein
MSTSFSIDGLPLLVGYAELKERYGWQKRTLQRWVKDGLMDRPTRLPGGRVYWQLEQIRKFIDRQFSGLTESAATDPEKLAPEQLERQAQELAAIAFERRTGKTVDPEDFLLNPIIDEADILAAETATRDMLTEFLRSLSPEQAAVTATGLFPQLRAALNELVRPEFLGTYGEYDAIRNAFTLFEMRLRLREAGIQRPPGVELLAHLAGFSLERASVIALRFFPALFAVVSSLRMAGSDGKLRPLFSNEGELQKLLLASLDDDLWADVYRVNGWRTDRVYLPLGRDC